MSYCRFSSDNWRSDVYCYADVAGGYSTHVAVNRVVGDIPVEPSWDRPIDDDWMREHRAVMDFLDTAERTPIGLPRDGEYYNDPDLPSFIARLESLRAIGYTVPQSAIDEARHELAEAQT